MKTRAMARTAFRALFRAEEMKLRMRQKALALSRLRSDLNEATGTESYANVTLHQRENRC